MPSLIATPTFCAIADPAIESGATIQLMNQALAELPLRSGHFILESGYHTDTWLTLDAVFREPRVVAPAIAALAEQLRAHDVSAVCGPFVGGAFLAQALATHMQLRFYYTTLERERSSASLFSARYQLPAELQRTAGNERFAVVDDAISAGSSVRATIAALESAGAQVLVVGTLVLLGNAAQQHFANVGLPIVGLGQRDLNLWQPANCPLCADGVRVEDPLL